MIVGFIHASSNRGDIRRQQGNTVPSVTGNKGGVKCNGQLSLGSFIRIGGLKIT